MSSDSNRLGWLWTALRGLRRLVVGLLAFSIILAAVVVGIGRVLIPYADEARPWLEGALTQRLGEPVSIQRVEAQWPRLTPQITLKEIHVGTDEDPFVRVDQARVEVHLDHLLQPGRGLVDLVVFGLDLVVEEDESGRWGLQLEAGGQTRLGDGSMPERRLTGRLLLRDARVRIQPRELPVSDWRLDEADLQRTAEQTLLVGQLHQSENESSRLELRLRVDHADTRLDALEAWFGIDGFGLDDPILAELLPGRVTESGRLMNAETWFEWDRLQGARVESRLSVSGGEREEVRTRVLVQRRGRRIDAEIVELTIGERLAADRLVLARDADHWAMAAERIDLAVVHEILEPWQSLVAWWPEQAAGQLTDVRVHYQRTTGLHAFNATLSDLALSETVPVPGIAGLDAELKLAGDRVVLYPGGTPTIEWPLMLRQPLSLDRIGGRVLLSAAGIEMDGVEIVNELLDARADGWIWFGEERPFLDFAIEVGRVGAGDPRPWLPHGIIRDNTLQWLDQALIRVGQASGGLLFHMRAGHRAVNFQPGDFHAWIDFSDSSMDYWPDWPIAELARGRVEFVGRGLLGRVPETSLGEVVLAVDPIIIPDLTAPELAFLVIGESAQAGALADVLADVPVPAWSNVLDATAWAGPVSFSAEVTLPFRRMVEWDIDGEVTLEEVDVELPGLVLGMRNLTGTTLFDRSGILPSVLNADAAGRMVTLDLDAVFEPAARLQLGGELHPADLLADDHRFGGLTEHVHGSSYWQLELWGGEDGGLTLTLDSDLEGLGLDLPEPLAKLPAEIWPLHFGTQALEDGFEGRLALGDVLDANLQSGPRGTALAVSLGADLPELPAPGRFDVEGRLDRFDLAPWIDLTTGLFHPGANGMLGRVGLSLGRLHYNDLYVEDVELALARDEESWQIVVDGAGVAGTATIPLPLDSGRVLAVDLARLHVMDDRPDDELTGPDDDEPVDVVSAASPRGYPPLHLLIEDLRYGLLELGRARIESHSTHNGMEIERFDLDGPDLRLQGRGRWVDHEDRPRSEFEGRLITASLTDLLVALGYQAGIEASRSQVDISGWWPGAPTDFALRRLDGHLIVEITDGLIPEARPGAGRLLGLVSLSTVPRRLMLDFRDVFAQGLKFDHIQGEFRLGDGLALTETMQVDSPAARIRVSGSADMIEKTYDQLLIVEPGVGSTLPILGGLAGGPVGAAAGLVLQTLFERPLRGITEARYAVTGSWDSPDVNLVEARVADEEGREETIVPELPPPD